MRNFKTYLIINELNEQFLQSICLEEAAELKDGYKKASPDTKGKLHELLVGYHLMGGNHMSKHSDIVGDSPKQAHDKLKETVHPDEYAKINERAKSAAEDIRHHVTKGGHSISDVHWTSKAGDLKRSTGIDASQKEDASDIVVHTKNAKSDKTKFHGVSLKVTDSASKHVPISNPGMESTHGAHTILEEHRRHLLTKFPAISTMTNKDQRKEHMRQNPKMAEYVKQKNKETKEKIADHLHKTLLLMDHDELVHHIKHHVLHAEMTPMERSGHTHIRHTTSTVGGEKNPRYAHHTIVPSKHHEHIFKDADNIKVVRSGATVHFHYKGKSFASHAIKFSSESDPMSGIKGSGNSSGD